jgi:hypothetical protein
MIKKSIVDPAAMELARLQTMTPGELRQRHQELFGYPSHSGNKQFLVKRLAWRWQVMRSPDFEVRIKRLRERALEIACDADLRIRPPRQQLVSNFAPNEAATGLLFRVVKGDGRLPQPGTIITREYKGRKLQVTVRQGGFDFEGQRFKSLSALAKHISGSHVNGFVFFRVGASKDIGGNS